MIIADPRRTCGASVPLVRSPRLLLQRSNCPLSGLFGSWHRQASSDVYTFGSSGHRRSERVLGGRERGRNLAGDASRCRAGADRCFSLSYSRNHSRLRQETHLLAALRENPQSSEINHSLGLFYLYHQDFSRSIHYLQESSRLGKTGRDYSRDLALAYLGAKQYSSVIALLPQASGAEKLDALSLRILAAAYYATGNTPQSIAEYRRAGEVDSSEETQFAVGMALMRIGATAEAAGVFHQATDGPSFVGAIMDGTRGCRRLCKIARRMLPALCSTPPTSIRITFLLIPFSPAFSAPFPPSMRK